MNKDILEAINNNLHQLADKKVTLGFDGFIDVILKVIRSKDDQQITSFFQSIHEFGTYITERGERNFSLELEEMTIKIGGNMPIMANALAQFGTRQQNCIGSMGYPSIDPVFQHMPSNCQLHSFANPGLTKALEFGGNKILLAEIGPLNQIKWDTIKEIIGLSVMQSLFSSPDLVCLLNWSEMDNSTAIWQGLLTDILPSLPASKNKPPGFFDLSDCSKRTPESIHEAMKLLQGFCSYWDVVLSLNLNEATLVNEVVSGTRENDIEKVGASLYDKLRLSGVVIHYSQQALYWSASGLHRRDSLYISNPTMSTGAGDNFNAGFCAGMMMELDAETCLALGHATAHLYMRHGKSPALPQLVEFLARLNTTVPLTANR